MTVWIASELRFIGKGTIESRDVDGNLTVVLADGRRGRCEPSQVFKTKREALLFSQVPQRGGWSDVAQLCR